MGKLRNNEKGFGAVEGLLIVAVVVLLGVVGYMIYKNHSTPTATKPTTATTTPSALTTASASQTVTDFYTKYGTLRALSDQTNLVKQDGTANLVSYFQNNQHGEDPIVCAQAIPETFSITSNTVSDNVATLVVKEIFGKDTVNVTAKVISQSGLKIDTIACPTPLPTGTP